MSRIFAIILIVSVVFILFACTFVTLIATCVIAFGNEYVNFGNCPKGND
jgi:hypothetical protein